MWDAEGSERGTDSAQSQMVSAWGAVVQLNCLIGTREIGPLWQTRTRGCHWEAFGRRNRRGCV